MSNHRRSALWRSPRFWLAIVAAAALPLLAEFNSRLVLSRQLSAEEATLAKQIEAEKARRETLLTLQTYIKSDDYVEHWARLARMVKPGEVAVVPVSDQAKAPATPTTQPSVLTANDVASEWWALFFGDTH